MGWLILSVFGAIFGSVANMLIYRLPRQMEVVVKPSHCTHCGATLRAPQLIPLLSYLWQGGKCHACASPIGLRYLLVEVAMVALFGLCYATHGETPLTLVLCGLAFCMVLLVAIDLEHMIIPDAVQVALALLGVAYGVLMERSSLEMVLCVLGGLLFALSLRQGMWWWKRREGLGWGDVKLLAVAGLYLSPAQFAPFCFIAGVAGVATALLYGRNRQGEFPFGPALGISMFVIALLPAQTSQIFMHVIDFIVEFSVATIDK